VLVIYILRKSGETIVDPSGKCRFDPGDVVTVQATLQAYQGLRDKLLAA